MKSQEMCWEVVYMAAMSRPIAKKGEIIPTEEYRVSKSEAESSKEEHSSPFS